MINKIIHFSVYHRGVVLFFTALLVAGGIYSFQHLPIDAVPDITNNQVQINTTIDGLVPEEIERTITFPIESAMRGMGGVEQVRSITRFGLSQVTVVFKDSVDIYRARQLVTERLRTAENNLPAGAEPRLGPISSGLGEIYQYVIEYKEPATQPEERFEQLMELKALQDWFVKPRLLTVEGIAEINTSGGFEKQFHIQPDPKKMATYRVHFGEIQEALKKVNKNVGGGYVEQTGEQFLVQGIGLLKSVHDIKQVPVKTLDNFRVIRVEDIANVTLGKELRTGAAVYNGRESVLGTVMMLLGENSRTVSIRADDKIKEIRQGLPPEIELKTVYDRSQLVNATLGTVEHNLLMGAGLVVVILLFLLGNVRAAIITALTIPFALLFTFTIMKPLGISGNLMSLGALDFGIIVDGTVIVLDNCVRYIHEKVKSLKRNLTKEELKEAIYHATVEIRVAAGFGELIIVVVFLPIFALTGIEGKMFIPMAATFAIAVVGALILSFTTAPALASLLLSPNSEDKEPKLMKWFQKRYLPLLDLATRKKKQTVWIGAASIVIGLILFVTRGAEFLPQLGEGSFAFHMIRPVNISLSQAVEFQEKADVLVKEFPEVHDVFSRLGTSEVATDPMGVNVADTYIMLKPRSEWPKVKWARRSYEELVQAIIEKLEKNLPGMNYLASQPIQMRFNELLEGTRADVAVKIYGSDLKTLTNLAMEIREVVETVPGAGDVESDMAGTSPVLRIVPKSELLAQYGANLSDVLESISVALGGEEAGYIYAGERKYPLVVRMSEKDRQDLDVIRDLPVGLPANATTPLSTLAKIGFQETYGVVNRENSSRRSTVMINLRGRDTESFVNEAQKLVSEKVKIPTGYFVDWGGNFKNLQNAKQRLMILTPIALALVLAMIYAAFGSLSQTLLIFSCVPLALVGGIVSLMIRGLPFSISAGIGFIALCGIAVLNGVVLVNYFNHLRSTEHLTGMELVKKAAMIRLRPVLMTALVAIFGFIPMMLSTGVGSEVQRPLATVVIGGLISSTLLTLVVLPVLYLIFENRMLKYNQRISH
ncbi:MAG: efflux RND transporter permease subunit [Oligoflexia bacterium]|nr:efflux RND transporter permease subunit [Oligoflexia bacterium]